MCDHAVTTQSQTYEACDVGAIIGNAFDANPGKVNLPHYKVRKMVMETQAARNRYWLSIDSNVFIYKDKLNPHRYLRYSFNGVFPATGIYCNDNPGNENWDKGTTKYNEVHLWFTNNDKKPGCAAAINKMLCEGKNVSGRLHNF